MLLSLEIFLPRKADIPNLSGGKNCLTFEKQGHVCCIEVI